MVFMNSFLRPFHSLINPLDPVLVCFLANHRKMSNSVFSLNVVNSVEFSLFSGLPKLPPLPLDSIS